MARNKFGISRVDKVGIVIDDETGVEYNYYMLYIKEDENDTEYKQIENNTRFINYIKYDYIEENKDKGIFEYTESYLFHNAYKAKYKEIELFKQTTLNTCILRLIQDNIPVFEVQTTVDEAQNVFLNKRNQMTPFYYFIRNENITIKNIPLFVADEGYNLCEDYRTKRNYVVNSILLKKLADCKTVEQIESIEFVEGQEIILAGEIFILSPLIIPIEKTPEMNIVPTETTQEN